MKPDFISSRSRRNEVRLLSICIIAFAAIGALRSAPQSDKANVPFVCGEDQKLTGPIELRWSTVVLAGDGRLFSPCDGRYNGPFHVTRNQPALDHREIREGDVVTRGLLSADKEIRWRAAQAMARMTSNLVMVGEVTHTASVIPACSARIQVFGGLQDLRRWQPGPLFRLLLDRESAVQAEAAYAIGLRLAEAKDNPDVVRGAAEELRVCFERPGTAVKDLILEDLGLAFYGTDTERTAAETFLVQPTGPPRSGLSAGALRGLNALFLQNPSRPVQQTTRDALKKAAIGGSALALTALQTAGDIDPLTADLIALADNSELHRILAARLNLLDPRQRRIAERFEHDEMPLVRYEILEPWSKLATQTGECGPIVHRALMKEEKLFIRTHALDMLVATCTDLGDVLPWMTDLAASLEKSETHKEWHLAARAFLNLARLRPDDAKPLLEPALKHPVWQVRAAVAAASVHLKDEKVALALANDPEPNVRTAVLDALFQLRSKEVITEAIKVLKSADDYQLLNMAAFVLKGLPDENKEDATEALLFALRKLTLLETDPSRDPRVAMIDRLSETMRRDQAGDLFPFLADFDDEVIAATQKTLGLLSATLPKDISPHRRYPFQMPEDALRTLPVEIWMTLETGRVRLEVLPDVAPVTLARFVALGRQGYYDGKTFHHVIPNGFVQGGSPGANDYMGAPRFIRDEVGPQARNTAQSVAMSNHGRDAGDGQFFINLVDNPRFDRQFTVFARVCGADMPLIEKLLDGEKIVGMAFSPISTCR